MPTANRWRRLARKVIPLAFRQEAAHGRRLLCDRSEGIVFHRRRGGQEWPVRIELTQSVPPSSLLENKLTNIRCGASLLNLSLIEPGGIWSFWNRIGRPSARNGFVDGRNLVGGRLVRQVGGGLCQLSGLVYHLALQSGLQIAERHPHSIDIYREEQRYTPLGADATVVWGFKDLRLRNPHPFPVSVGCLLHGTILTGHVRCAEALAMCDVSFIREDTADGRVRVQTMVDGIALWNSEYERRPGLEVG